MHDNICLLFFKYKKIKVTFWAMKVAYLIKMCFLIYHESIKDHISKVKSNSFL